MARELAFAAALLIAAATVTVGAFLAATPAGFVVAGVLFAGWSWLILGGDEVSGE